MEEIIILSILSFLFVYIGTKFLQKILEKNKIFDIPNERSSHTKPIPKGGGLIFLLIFIPFFIYFNEYHLLITILALAVISWFDDIKNLSVVTRLISQFLIIFILLLLSIGHIFSFHLIFESLILTFLIMWFINIFNFMDGIDGITPSIVITFFLGYCLALETNEILPFIFIFSCLGFLILNWYPAKIFLGDVGSIPLGFVSSIYLLQIILHGEWEWAISLTMYYILDTSITLIGRFVSGKKIWEAHREHFYQKAIQSGMKHSEVVILIVMLQFLIILTCYYIKNPYLVVFLTFFQSIGLIIYFSSKYKKST